MPARGVDPDGEPIPRPRCMGGLILAAAPGEIVSDFPRLSDGVPIPDPHFHPSRLIRADTQLLFRDVRPFRFPAFTDDEISGSFKTALNFLWHFFWHFPRKRALAASASGVRHCTSTT